MTAALVIALAALAIFVWWRHRHVVTVTTRVRALVGLRRAHGRLELAAFKHEVRREAGRLCRELDQQLNNIDKGGES
jgi:hypothetical protein